MSIKKTDVDAPMPSAEEIAKHEQAAESINQLRRKGVPCHVEKRASLSGERVDVVVDPSIEHSSGELPEPGH